jgi:hypothetical protein
MKQQHHKLIAISLALLVLISTTGISMNMMLCSCTGKEYLSMMASVLELDCCKIKKTIVKAAKVKKHDCCSKAKACKKTEKKEIDVSKPTIIAKKDCCTPTVKYSKANINLTFGSQEELSSCKLLLPSHYSVQATYYNNSIVAQAAVLGVPQNKAPPRCFGHALLNWYQTYRC